MAQHLIFKRGRPFRTYICPIHERLKLRYSCVLTLKLVSPSSSLEAGTLLCEAGSPSSSVSEPEEIGIGLCLTFDPTGFDDNVSSFYFKHSLSLHQIFSHTDGHCVMMCESLSRPCKRRLRDLADIFAELLPYVDIIVQDRGLTAVAEDLCIGGAAVREGEIKGQCKLALLREFRSGRIVRKHIV